jgi:hypothetical protein
MFASVTAMSLIEEEGDNLGALDRRIGHRYKVLRRPARRKSRIGTCHRRRGIEELRGASSFVNSTL